MLTPRPSPLAFHPSPFTPPRMQLEAAMQKLAEQLEEAMEAIEQLRMELEFKVAGVRGLIKYTHAYVASRHACIAAF